MPAYCWFSKELSDRDVGRRTTGKDGVERTGMGYAIVLDEETGKLSQYNFGGEDPAPAVNKRIPDVQLAAVISDPKNASVALNCLGEISPVGERVCKEHGLPVTAASLKSLVRDFYEPHSPPGYTPKPADVRTLPKPPKT